MLMRKARGQVLRLSTDRGSLSNARQCTQAHVQRAITCLLAAFCWLLHVQQEEHQPNWQPREKRPGWWFEVFLVFVFPSHRPMVSLEQLCYQFIKLHDFVICCHHLVFFQDLKVSIWLDWGGLDVSEGNNVFHKDRLFILVKNEWLCDCCKAAIHLKTHTSVSICLFPGKVNLETLKTSTNSVKIQSSLTSREAADLSENMF